MEYEKILVEYFCGVEKENLSYINSLLENKILR